MTAPVQVGASLRAGEQRLAASSREPRRDAELLLLHLLQKDRTWLLTHPEGELTPDQGVEYNALLARRAKHEPMQYILGEQEFYGLRLVVGPGVLIPRPETEHLVEAALARLSRGQPARIADVGTGSGAIALVLAHERPQAEVTALDSSQAALHTAKTNAAALGLSLRLLHSDLLAAVQGERFDMIVSNPPYIPDDDVLEAQVRDWEPSSALYAGPLGLSVYQRLIPQARQALVADGWLLLELGHGQQAALAGLLADWAEVSFVDDLQGIPRVVAARRL